MTRTKGFFYGPGRPLMTENARTSLLSTVCFFSASCICLLFETGTKGAKSLYMDEKHKRKPTGNTALDSNLELANPCLRA